jgi:flavin reductase (DIM6/NTAB) family NADH-FMN oxidoreductase RutF
MTGDDFRHAVSHFATGVTVVTTLRAEGVPVGTTASAVSSLSLEPPLLLVCLARTSTTLAAVRAHGAFAVNVLAAEQRELSTHFARSGAAAVWDTVSYRVSQRALPLLQGALATLECSLERCVDGGDHEIVVGRVRELDVAAAEVEPLLHFRGNYAGLIG